MATQACADAVGMCARSAWAPQQRHTRVPCITHCQNAGLESLPAAGANGGSTSKSGAANGTAADAPSATPGSKTPAEGVGHPPPLRRFVSQDPLDRVQAFVPRMERLCRKRGLDQMEKAILLTLVGCVISQEVRKVCSAVMPTCAAVSRHRHAL